MRHFRISDVANGPFLGLILNTPGRGRTLVIAYFLYRLYLFSKSSEEMSEKKLSVSDETFIREWEFGL